MKMKMVARLLGSIAAGCLLAAPGLALGQGQTQQRTIDLNFNNVELKLVVRALGELTGRNFVYDEAVVKGTVTVHSVDKVSVEEAYQALGSILEVKGLVAVASGDTGLIKILPAAEAKMHYTAVGIGKTLQGVPKDDHIHTQVIRLQHADAQEVWRLLAPYVPKEGSIVHSPDTNTIIITDTSANIYRLLRIIQEVDRESPAGRKRIYVYRLQNADPEEMAKVLTGIPVRGSAGAPGATKAPVRMSEAASVRQQPTIVADPASNSLVIAALPVDYEVLKEVIEQLDIVRAQVLVEALIAEVSLDRLVDIGVEWASADEPAEGKDTVVGGTNFDFRRELETGTLMGLGLGLMRGTTLAAVLAAHGRDTGFEILSSPYIITRDNEEARILVGENIGYVSQSRFTDTDVATPTVIRTWEYRDVGIEMSITPHVNPEGSVRLEMKQVIETLLEGPEPGVPTTAKRSLENTIDVMDGHTVVVGGLFKDNTVTVVSKVPFLGDLPLLGWLFRRSREVEVKTSLLIFITPHVVRSPEEMRALTEKKRQEGEEAAPEPRGSKKNRSGESG